jgi:putative RNA 2'-phosphotransferase
VTDRSRFLSLVLRHRPERAGIALDAAGWVAVDDLLAGAARAGVTMTREELDGVFARNAKRRFAFDESGTRIRAVQGHSVEVELGYSAAIPPAVLFHGTHPAALAAVLEQGLRPMGRRHVHLSADEETARAAGARRGRPQVLEIDARAMHADGAAFWQASNGVWLCEAVPPHRLRVR